MLTGVQLVGLALDEVPVGGPQGPLSVRPEPAGPLAIYRLEGWGPEEEAQGHKVLRLMEAVGQAAADDHIDPEDVEALVQALDLPGAAAIGIIVSASRRLIEAVRDDGRVDAREALGIVSTILQSAGVLR